MFMLDTCTISDFFGGNESVHQRLKAARATEIAISAISVMEVQYGFLLNPAAKRRYGTAFQSLIETVQIAPFDTSSSECAATIRASLKQRGTPIGPWDLLIGATALAYDYVLITSNIGEFQRVDNLRIENWR